MKPQTDTSQRYDRSVDVAFAFADYCGGVLVGVATTVAVRAVVRPELDMVLAMILGMGVGMLTHLVMGVLLLPVLGMFHTMVPGSLIGMYGGMLFAMRDSMQTHAASTAQSLAVGAVFGLLVVAGVRIYDRVLRAAPGSNGVLIERK